jgi:hypothetical protein
MLFVASAKGIAWLWSKIYGKPSNECGEWVKVLKANSCVDDDDLGHVRLTAVLRALMAAKTTAGGYDDRLIDVVGLAFHSLQFTARETLLSCVPDPDRVLNALSATTTSADNTNRQQHTAADDENDKASSAGASSSAARSPIAPSVTAALSSPSSLVNDDDTPVDDAIASTPPRTLDDMLSLWIDGGCTLLSLIVDLPNLDGGRSLSDIESNDAVQQGLHEPQFWKTALVTEVWRAGSSSELQSAAMRHWSVVRGVLSGAGKALQQHSQKPLWMMSRRCQQLLALSSDVDVLLDVGSEDALTSYHVADVDEDINDTGSLNEQRLVAMVCFGIAVH